MGYFGTWCGDKSCKYDFMLDVNRSSMLCVSLGFWLIKYFLAASIMSLIWSEISSLLAGQGEQLRGAWVIFCIFILLPVRENFFEVVSGEAGAQIDTFFFTSEVVSDPIDCRRIDFDDRVDDDCDSWTDPDDESTKPLSILSFESDFSTITWAASMEFPATFWLLLMCRTFLMR